ncbi:MAG: hypothetical protein ACYDC5_05830 [Candidatus Dormibacteria bacterium]
MGWHRFKTGLAVVGGCVALSVVLPPLGALFNAVGSLTLLALAAYAAYRGWAFMESVVEASRRPTTVRRNLRDAPERSSTHSRESARDDPRSQEAPAPVEQQPRHLRTGPERRPGDRRLRVPFKGR